MSVDRSDWGRLWPLVVATMGSQAILVVLAPTIVDVARSLDVSVSAVSQARTVTAAAAIAATIPIARAIDLIGVQRIVAWGGLLSGVGLGAAAAAPSLALYLAAHVPAGAGFACLLSGGFAGVAGFTQNRRAWAMGHVAAANALAWIVANPAVGALTEVVSWRAAHLVPVGIVGVAVLAARRCAEPDEGTPVPGSGLGAVLGDRSARRWTVAEMTAFLGWAGSLIFIGALLIERHEVGEAAAGVILALGAVAYYLTATRTAGLDARFGRRGLVTGSSVAMAASLVAVFSLDVSWWFTAILFCLIGVFGGVRTPIAGSLGMAQLPERPGAMMTARTAATQLGYLLGALIGGAAIAWSGYPALGLALAAALVVSAWMFAGVAGTTGAPDDRARSVGSSGR